MFSLLTLYPPFLIHIWNKILNSLRRPSRSMPFTPDSCHTCQFIITTCTMCYSITVSVQTKNLSFPQTLSTMDSSIKVIELYSASTRSVSAGIAPIVKGNTAFPARPAIHLQAEWAIPVFAFPATAGTHLPTQRDGRREASRPWCEVAPAEIRTCHLLIAYPALYHTSAFPDFLNERVLLLWSFLCPRP